jgi:hypothetical protein
VSNLTVAIVTVHAVLLASVLAGVILVRMARRRGVRLRDLVGPGGG